MKNEINRIDFETWDSWNMPYYTKSIGDLPYNNLEKHFKEDGKKSNTLWLIIAGLCVTLVITNWEQLVTLFQKITKEVDEESVKQPEEAVTVETPL